MQDTDKKNKKGLKITAVVILSVVLVHFILTLCFVLVDYNYNSKLSSEQGVISNQYDEPFASFKYGGLGNVKANGCGAVAVYNIMRLEGKNVSFSDVVKYFDVNGNYLYGKFGTRPSKIIAYLKNFGFDVGFAFFEENFDNVAKQSKYTIFLYVGEVDGQMGGHYQLLTQYNNRTGKYLSINPSKNVSFPDLLKMTEKCFKMIIYIK